MKLIYIGDHFYFESGTMMSSIYTEDGKRSDWLSRMKREREQRKKESQP